MRHKHAWWVVWKPGVLLCDGAGWRRLLIRDGAECRCGARQAKRG